MSDDQEDPDEPSGADQEDEGPIEGSDLHTRGTPTWEEWTEMLNRADPWDQTLRAQEEFEQTEPPVEAIKAYRREARYYLLHRGKTAVDRLRYRAYNVDVDLRWAERPTLYELRDLPPRSVVEVGRIDLGGQRRMLFTLVAVKWSVGRVHECGRKGERWLRIFDHSDGVPTLEALDLSPVEQEPVMVSEDDASVGSDS